LCTGNVCPSCPACAHHYDEQVIRRCALNT